MSYPIIKNRSRSQWSPAKYEILNRDTSKTTSTVNVTWYNSDQAIGQGDERYPQHIQTNPYSRALRRVEIMGGGLQETTTHTYSHPNYQSAYGGTTGSMVSMPVWPAPYFESFGDPTQLKNRLQSELSLKYWNKLADALTQWDLPVFAGEFHQTQRLVVGTLKSFVSLHKRTHDLTRGLVKLLSGTKSKRGRRDLRRRISKAWLQYQFGVKQLGRDLVSFGDAINALSNSFEFQRVAASVNDSYVVSSTSQNGGYNGLSYSITRNDTVEVSGRAVGLYKRQIQQPDYPSKEAAQILGLDLRRIVPTMWELTPFSWVVDYFLPFGSWLNQFAYEQTAAAYFYSSWKTIRRHQVIVHPIRTIPPTTTLYTMYGEIPVYYTVEQAVSGSYEIVDEYVQFERGLSLVNPCTLTNFLGSAKIPGLVQGANLVALMLASLKR